MTRVLFVDDELQVLEGLEDMLRARRSPWQLDFAVGGAQALEKLAAASADAPFDVVVTDMRMPGMNGAELMERVRVDWPGLVRIILSGYSDPSSALRAVPVAHEFLSKPCSPEALAEAVDRARQLQAALSAEPLRLIVAGTGDMPAAPEVFAALTTLLSSAEPSIAEIAALVERDVGVSAKLLQIVNSAFFGRSRRIFNVAEAITLLGLSLLRGLVLSVEVFTVFKSRPGSRFSIELLEHHAAQVGSIACSFVGAEERSEALIAGLLHDVGRLLLASKRPDELEEILRLHDETGRPLHELEFELLGTTHAEIGASLLALWGLPFPIVGAVANHHVPERTGASGIDLAAAVAIADALAYGLEPSADLLARDGAAQRIAEWQSAARPEAATA